MNAARHHLASRAACPLLLVLALLTLGVESPAAGESWELPFELSLDAEGVALELWNAEVSISVESSGRPTLRAAVVDSQSTARLDVLGGETIRLERPEETEPVRIRLDLTLDLSQRLRLVGRELTVTSGLSLDDEATAAEEEELDPSAVPRGAFELVLERSRADLSGLSNAELSLADSAAWVDGSAGSVQLILRGGSVEMRRHQGPIGVLSRDAEVAIIDVRGDVVVEQGGGGLRLERGNGKLEGGSEGGIVVLDEWNGGMNLRVIEGSIDARDSIASQPWQLQGSYLQGSFERVQGELQAGFNGGSLRVRQHQGKLTLTTRESARVELERVDGEVHLDLGEGSEARVAGVGRVLAAKVDDARLEARDVTLLQLEAGRSQIEASGVRRVHRLQIADSRLWLDMTDAESNFALELSGSTRVDLLLASPCEVRLVAGTAARAGEGVDVSNCDLHLPGQPRESSRTRHFRYGTRGPRIVNLTLDQESSIRVEGLP